MANYVCMYVYVVIVAWCKLTTILLGPVRFDKLQNYIRKCLHVFVIGQVSTITLALITTYNFSKCLPLSLHSLYMRKEQQLRISCSFASNILELKAFLQNTNVIKFCTECRNIFFRNY